MNAIIMGIGPIKIPLVLCESEDAAKKYLADIGLVPDAKGLYEVPTVNDIVPEPVASALFKYHYFGCGGCYEVQIVPAPFNTPLVAWDLD